MPEAAGGFDAREFPGQADVHEHEVGLFLPRHGDGRLAGGRPIERIVAHPGQTLLEVHRHDALVFHDQDTRRTRAGPYGGGAS